MLWMMRLCNALPPIFYLFDSSSKISCTIGSNSGAPSVFLYSSDLGSGHIYVQVTTKYLDRLISMQKGSLEVNKAPIGQLGRQRLKSRSQNLTSSAKSASEDICLILLLPDSKSLLLFIRTYGEDVDTSSSAAGIPCSKRTSLTGFQRMRYFRDFVWKKKRRNGNLPIFISITIILQIISIFQNASKLKRQSLIVILVRTDKKLIIEENLLVNQIQQSLIKQMFYSIIFRLRIIIPSMKKYQLWMERKSYSQHLSNLMKIRIESIERRTAHQTAKINESCASPPKSHFSKTKSASKSLERSPLGSKSMNKTSNLPSMLVTTTKELSYVISPHQLKNHKLCLMKSYEILNQNKSMLRRIQQAKPLTSTHQKNDGSLFKIKKLMQRKNKQNSQQLKNIKFKHFLQFQKDRISLNHKFILSITISACSKRMPRNESTQIWCELFLQSGSIKSQLVSGYEFMKHTFSFPLMEALPSTFVLKLWHCKGLTGKKLGEYVITRPNTELERQKEYYSINQIENWIKADIGYRKVAKKFWDVRFIKT